MITILVGNDSGSQATLEPRRLVIQPDLCDCQLSVKASYIYLSYLPYTEHMSHI